MEKISAEEMKNVNGGMIVYAENKYWAVSDDGQYMVAKGFQDYNDAAKFCDEFFWEVGAPVYPNQYEEKFGKKFIPVDCAGDL